MGSHRVLLCDMLEEARPGTLSVTKSYEDHFLRAFDEYSDALFRHACFRLSNREVATDLTQETFIKAWEYLRKGQEIREWKSFLYRILHNLIIDHYRRKKERSLDELLEKDSMRMNAHIATGSRTEHEERLNDEQLIEKIRTLIPRLPEQQRIVLTLRYVDGFSPKEIASTTGISENVVSVRIHRAVKELRKLCKDFIPL